ncbi:MAG TPA: GGDEF domain-containing protein [Planctomycetes bacterium]|nr:GGDEF domain-containing protein [Planctomycetota bacterium]
MTALAFETTLPEALTRADDLPSLPTVALEVLQITQDENSTIDELAACISRDPALAAKILKLSNSSLFNVGQEIRTLQRATMVLGLKTVKLMSLSFSLVGSIPREGNARGFDFREYWHRSLVRSVAARSMARFVHSQLSDEAFLCGLLAHFGRLALSGVMTEEYEKLAAECNGWPSAEDELRAFGFRSSDLCATMLKEWNVPEMIYMGTGYCDRPDELPVGTGEDTVALVGLLQLAALAEGVICGGDHKGDALEELNRRMKEEHEKTEGEVEAFMLGLGSGIHETADMLSIQLPQGVSYEEILSEAKQQMVNVSLGTVAALQKTAQERDHLAAEKEKFRSQAVTDSLTGLPNRAAFDEFLEMQVQDRLENKVPLCLGVIMVDIDHFKGFNDTHGHAAGDAVLKMVGEVLSERTRKGDLAARYGGEEFVIVAPRTNPYQLNAMAERLREGLEKQSLCFEGKDLQVTASFGGACIADVQKPSDGRALVKLADSLLYRAKENGRNRCETYRKSTFPGRS